ncbi:MAG: 1-deoxy-D-xylulose-5-phosphate reductoisomerase, partial [Dehalococcoidales bacterium]
MGDAVKQVAVLGSTGSIGQQTLDIIRTFPHLFKVVGLAAGTNIDLLTRQIHEFKPELVYCKNKDTLLTDAECRFASLEEIASHPRVDTVVIATSGKSGLNPALAAVRTGKEVALANKEPLVMAGEIITTEARLNGAQILPVDSEHSAIWQCLRGERQKASRIILTASGGPFYNLSPDELNGVSVEQAIRHPSWQMGRKITIDCATLMNKGLEVMEARWLFDIPLDKISILVHRQSIIHSMVEFIDGSIKAQLSYPDMRLPIQYALCYPERQPNERLPRLDWDRIKELTFEPVDPDVFPCLKLAIEAGRQRGTCPAVLCAADEVAVDLFLTKRIKFTDIACLVEQTLERHETITNPSLEEILAADAW